MALAVLAVVLMAAPRQGAALDISSVSIHVFKEYENNVLTAPDPFPLELVVCGLDFIGVTVTPPLGGPLTLMAEPGFPGCLFEEGIEPHPDFPVPPIGNYQFSFTGQDPDTGAPVNDMVRLHFDPDQTTGFANVTFPQPGAGNVPVQPVFRWDSAVGFGSALGVTINESTGEELASDLLPITATSWSSPVVLSHGENYDFFIEVDNLIETPALTEAGDAFLYSRSLLHENDIHFRTTTCGDGVVDTGEECDDGNNVGGDSCSADCLFGSALAADYDFEHVTCPGAATSTELNGINDHGDVVGVYDGVVGFLRLRSSTGTCTATCASDFPGAVDREATSINNAGDIVGGVGDFGGDADFGYLLKAGSDTCELLDCAQGTDEWTSDINESGQVVDSFDGSGGTQGFEWASGGPCEPIPFCPGATFMELVAITNSGVIVGIIEDAAGRHVFRIDDWRTDPTCVIIPIPVPPGTTIDVGGINDDLAIVGTFINPGDPDEELGTAFLYENETVTEIDPCPAEAASCLALGKDINNLDQIVGSYDLDGFDGIGERIGFIASFPDQDRDGVAERTGRGTCQTGQTDDCSDNCPFEPNNSGDDLQRDTDGNGRGDACECGNADLNEAVDIFDALHIAQGTLQPPLVTMIHPRACDADGNGTCDIFDALRVAQATLTPPLAAILQECEAATVPPAP